MCTADWKGAESYRGSEGTRAAEEDDGDEDADVADGDFPAAAATAFLPCPWPCAGDDEATPAAGSTNGAAGVGTW